MLFGIGAVLAYVDPALVAVPANQSQLYEGRIVWLLAGILFIGVGSAFSVDCTPPFDALALGRRKYFAGRHVFDSRG